MEQGRESNTVSFWSSRFQRLGLALAPTFTLNRAYSSLILLIAFALGSLPDATWGLAAPSVPAQQGSSAGVPSQAVLRAFLAQVIAPVDSSQLVDSLTAAERSATKERQLRDYLTQHPELWSTLDDPAAVRSGLIEILDSELPSSSQNSSIQRLKEQTEFLEQLDTWKSARFIPGPIKEFSPQAQREFLVSTLSSPRFQEVLDDTFAQAAFSKTPAVEKFKGSSLFRGVQGIPSEQLQRLNDGLSRYFDGFSPTTKRQIVSELLALSPGQAKDDFAKLGILIQNSGPAFQKLLQLLGNDVEDPQIKATFKQLLSDVKPFSGAQAKQEIAKQLGGGFDDLFYAFEEKPIAAATIGQVHTARMKSTGEKIVIKVMRPGIEARFDAEMIQLRSVFGAEDPLLSRLLSQMEKTVKEEMDFNLERANYAHGKVYIQPEAGLSVALPKENIPASKSVLVLEMAKGQSFKSLNPEIIPALERKIALESLTSSWFENALFGDGFFHADLHGGNFFYQRLPGQKPPYRVSLIDLGSAGRLSPVQQQGFIELAFGVVSKDVDHIVEGIRKFSSLDATQEQALRSRLQSLLPQLAGKDPTHAISEVLKSAVQLNVPVDAEVLLFNRGRMFLESAIRQLNKELPKASQISPMVLYTQSGIKKVKGGQLTFLRPEDLPKAWGEIYPRLRHKAKSTFECLIQEFQKRRGL